MRDSPTCQDGAGAGGAPLRAAIIGTGRIASRLEKDPLRPKPHTHAGWYASHDRTTLVAGADVDAGALEAFGADWGVAADHLYADYREMLARERPDVVSVCAFAPERVEMCEAAIAAGARALWIEKAIACSVCEAESLASTIAAAGVCAIVDHPRRADPRYRAIKRFIDSGTLGRLETAHVLFSGNWIHTGTHAWDVLQFWCGPWARAAGWAEPAVDAGGAAPDGREASERAQVTETGSGHPDTGGHAHVVFENGVHAFVSGSRKRYFVFQFDLVFERGRVQVGNDVWSVTAPAPSPRYTGFVELDAAAGRDAAAVVPDDEYPDVMVRDLVHALDGGGSPLMSVGNAVEALRLGMGVLQSATRGGEWVPRAAVDPALKVRTL